MNDLLRQQVEFPPIVAFKESARSTRVSAPRSFDMTQAVPSFPTFKKIRERLSEAVLTEEVSFYSDVPGILPLRSAICARHPLGRSFRPDDVIVTAGANHAAFTALILHFVAGDVVGLPEPFYFNYDMALKMLGMVPKYLPMPEASGFDLRADDLIRHLENSPVKGLFLITPNNPTGATYATSEILKLLKWTAPKGIEVILDETYMRFDPGHLGDPAIGGYIGKGLTLIGSFSKVYSLTGYRVGYLISTGATIREALKIQDTSVICAPHIGQKAALFGLESCESDVAQQLEKTARLGKQLADRAKALRRFQLSSHGAFFAFLKHPFDELSCEAATLRLYEKSGILGLPGTVFGSQQSRFIRLAFCNLTEADLDAALDQLVALDHG